MGSYSKRREGEREREGERGGDDVEYVLGQLSLQSNVFLRQPIASLMRFNAICMVYIFESRSND